MNIQECCCYREDLKVDILKHEDQDTPEQDCDEGVHVNPEKRNHVCRGDHCKMR